MWHEELANNYFALWTLEGTAEGSRTEYPHVTSDSGTKRIEYRYISAMCSLGDLHSDF
jgi:hypothetical protein